ncbi:MAG: NYN domain-containing protein [Streptosporangiaceae bacterium]
MTDIVSPLPTLARYAIMIDVGYIYAAAGELLFSVGSRREYRVDTDKLIQALTRHADGLVRGELLRVYWYDAARDRVPTIDQRVIAQMARVKLRLGNLNARGQQKGVDAQIRADMEALARHRAITDAVLVAGDEDMVPAVEAAQAYGVRVHLWGVEPPFGTNQAERLVWESDTVEVLDRAFLEPYFTRVPPPEPVPSTAPAASVPSPAQLFERRHGVRQPHRPSPHPALIPPSHGHPLGQPAVGQPSGVGQSALGQSALGQSGLGQSGLGQSGLSQSGLSQSALASRLGPDRQRVEEAGEHVAQKWILTRGEDNIRDLLPGPILPPVIDKELLVEAEKELGASLRPYQEAREWLLDAFWERVRRQFGIGSGRS